MWKRKKGARHTKSMHAPGSSQGAPPRNPVSLSTKSASAAPGCSRLLVVIAIHCPRLAAICAPSTRATFQQLPWTWPRKPERGERFVNDESTAKSHTRAWDSSWAHAIPGIFRAGPGLSHCAGEVTKWTECSGVLTPGRCTRVYHLLELAHLCRHMQAIL